MNKFTMMVLAVLSIGMLVFTACGDDDPATDAGTDPIGDAGDDGGM